MVSYYRQGATANVAWSGPGAATASSISNATAEVVSASACFSLCTKTLHVCVCAFYFLCSRLNSKCL